MYATTGEDKLTAGEGSRWGAEMRSGVAFTITWPLEENGGKGGRGGLGGCGGGGEGGVGGGGDNESIQ